PLLFSASTFPQQKEATIPTGSCSGHLITRPAAQMLAVFSVETKAPLGLGHRRIREDESVRWRPGAEANTARARYCGDGCRWSGCARCYACRFGETVRPCLFANHDRLEPRVAQGLGQRSH